MPQKRLCRSALRPTRKFSLTAGTDFPMPAIISASAAEHEIVSGIAAGRFHIHFPQRFTNWLRVARR
jgi:hypothetical protein